MIIRPSFALRTVEAWLATLSLEQADGDVFKRRRWTYQTEMASHLGTVSDVLSRVSRELTKGGLIEMDKQLIRILDRAGLSRAGMDAGKIRTAGQNPTKVGAVSGGKG